MLASHWLQKKNDMAFLLWREIFLRFNRKVRLTHLPMFKVLKSHDVNFRDIYIYIYIYIYITLKCTEGYHTFTNTCLTLSFVVLCCFNAPLFIRSTGYFQKLENRVSNFLPFQNFSYSFVIASKLHGFSDLYAGWKGNPEHKIVP